MNPDLHPFAHRLARDLAGTLPGEKAQSTMAPQPRHSSEHGSTPQAKAKTNGVLILLYPHHGALFLPLILRPTYPGVHSGQVSLPGGRIEPEDRSVVDTALREAEEEIGVPRNAVTVLGELSPLFIGASNNIVYPVVGWTGTRPDFVTDDREVAKLIETQLGALLDPDNVRSEQMHINGRTATVPYYRLSGQNVWGATAMILGELLALPSVNDSQ